MHHEIQLPQRLGPYVVLERIATGGFSIAAKCRHVDTQRIVAVKLVVSDPDHRVRLRHEARVLARLSHSPHPGVIELLDTGIEHGVPWAALCFIAGPDLTSLCRTRRRGQQDNSAEVARLGHCIADALAHVHLHGIAHCDVSPRNILLKGGTEPVLIDFDSAVVTFDGSAMREVGQSLVTLHGTPGYASPEQIRGLLPDSRSDLYALGCILYELVSGEPPFQADSIEALCQQHLHLEPAPLSPKAPWLPPELDDLISRLLQKDPRARVGRAEEVMDVLGSFSGRGEQLAAPKARPWNLHRPNLIGREGAIDSIVGSIDEAALGRGGVFVVSGKSGIGKTRVLNEVAHRARGFRVMFGRCAASTGSRVVEKVSTGRALEPFLPFLEWLASYYETRGASASAELVTALAVLSPYEPALAAIAPTPSVPSLPPELGRSRVLQSLLEVLLVASADRPLLLMIDDLQWADDLTRAFLHEHYRSALESSSVLIVAAHRAEEPAPEYLGDEVRRIQLEPLSWDELGVMAMDMLGTELVPAGLAEALHRHSEGNPFFAAEYLRGFIECGLLHRDTRGDWQLSEVRQQPGSISLPPSLRDLFGLRTGALSPGAKQVLEIAALLGRQFRGALLQAVIGEAKHGASLRDALDELIRHRILGSSGIDQYCFVHDKLREAQAEAIPEGRRRGLHRRIAALLETCGIVPGFQISLAELGMHWAEANEPAKSICHLQAAAEQAAARFMSADAAELYALALSQIDAAKSQDAADDANWTARAISLGEARGDVLGWSARHEEACAEQHATLALVKEHDVLLRARLERKKAKAYWTLHDYDNAMAALNRADALLGDVRDLIKEDEIREWIEVQQGFFWLHYFARRACPSMAASMQHMTAVVARYGTSIQRSMFYEYAACETLASDNYRYSERALAFARRANSEVSTAHGQSAQAADARFGLAFVLVQGGAPQCREAVELLEANLGLLNSIGEATLLTRSLVYLAIARRRLGGIQSTHVVAARARRFAERVRLIPYIGASLACEAWVQWKSSDTIGARRSAEEACARWSNATHAFPFQWLAKLVLLDLHYVNDDFDAAASVISELLDAQQQRFHEEMDAGLRACSETLKVRNDQRAASLALSGVLGLARRHAYL